MLAQAPARLPVTIASHHFIVHPKDVDARKICYDFVRRYMKIDVQGNSETITTYAAADAKRSWFRFHINSLKEWKEFLYARGTAEIASYTVRPFYTPTKVSLPLKDGATPKPEQEPVVEYLAAPVGIPDPTSGLYPDGTGALARLVGISTGGGKAQPLHSKIRTPRGWEKMGSMKIGTEILAWDGTVTKVKGVYPQGEKYTFRMILSDGRESLACAEHLWKVYTKDGQSQVISTEAVQVNLEKGVELSLNYPVPDPDLLLRVKPWLFRQLGAAKRGHVNVSSDLAALYVNNIRSAGGWATSEHIHNSQLHRVAYDLNPGKFIRIADVKPTSLLEECQCIEVEHPDKLYVTDDFIVTHNTFCALNELSRRGEVFMVVVLAQFVDKWVGDIANWIKVDKKQILAVKGGNAVMGLTQMAVTKDAMKGIKAIVVSNRSYENYLKAYERFEGDMEAHGYFCSPDEIWQRLGVGTRLVDEVHMQFYANYRLDLYTHVPQSISLSATLISSDPVQERLYRTAYPMADRYKEGPVKRYIDDYAIRYSTDPRWKYRTSYNGSSYSQNAYEESILKIKPFKEAYMKMIGFAVDIGFAKNYKPGNKGILFAGTVAMCTEITKSLQTKYPQWNIQRYVSEDNYKTNYEEPDFRVTTIGSGGVGHDVKGFTDGYLTNGIDSIQSNIQARGRVREIPGVGTRWWWMTNTDIPKHLKYDKGKVELSKQRGKSFTPLSYGMLS